MKAVSYLRVSSVGAIEGDGFPRQRETIQKYAAANQIEIVEEFRDEGVPGTTELKNRTGLAACVARVENNGVKLVLIESADRLARDSMIAELIIREFQKAGVRVVTASGGVDLTAGDNSNPTAKLVRQILAAVAEFDRCMIELKLRAARARMRSKGERCEGVKPFGTLPGEAETLEEIRSAHKSGIFTDEIAAMLNQKAIPARSGKLWRGSVIRKILARDRNSKLLPHVPHETSV